ncbi:hypothetical protein ZOSMA_28G00750 [Zostera marina]|uniref:t-SNARE coiled-coil homology domain-containing protein n=1 Tax=Zostera marina TaxID=29655 RepID=A0A0K9PES7_ZOSMR|nr:hypothetical protein ZOSMA_28G00750 [Zostera marina]
MNNLFSGSFRKFGSERSSGGGDLEMGGGGGGGGGGGANLDEFFKDVESVKDELKELEDLQRSLNQANETSKSLHQPTAIKALRSRMDADVNAALKKAKLMKLRLESLDRANASNRSVPNCGPGSSTDRTRTSVVAGLRNKLKDNMEEFNKIRVKVASEYRETVERRYFTVTGTKAEESTVDSLIDNGEAETFLQRAIQQQGGRGEVMDVVSEIRERHGATKEIERSLGELHQVFLDMSVLVASQGEQINDIENNVYRASSFVRGGTESLQVARNSQKNSRKWVCIGILALIVIILVIVIPIVINST